MTESHKLRVFLCHASQDKPIVRELYQRLNTEGWINPWLDEEKLLPGQDWDLEIEKSVEAADVVIVCLSTGSVSKEGYVQREMRLVLDIALEKPEGTIFVVPLRLDECELPRRLRSWHYVDYFPSEGRDQAYKRLLRSLDVRSSQLKSKTGRDEKTQPNSSKSTVEVVEEKKPATKEIPNYIIDLLLKRGSGEVNVGGSVLQILFFSLASLDSLAPSDSLTKILMGIFAILAGIVFLIKKQIPATLVFKISTIIYLLLFGLGWRIDNLLPFAPLLAGIAALISGGVLILNVQTPKKQVFYSSISFALFLFFVGIYYVWTTLAGYPPIINEVDTLILITSIISSVLLLRDL
jgi:hypothetical protein